ncbi:hypothetical protein [Brevundimonas sp.]|uniref:hypothetical protein n=1 Tax=Brevundimonas sp. TaxID=1871086 RepID=UPI001D662BE5|nr:hypothetical protein [Brevundimonas sp.]MBL0947296.1 hypothetical protein [Brevundimonas sp.]
MSPKNLVRTVAVAATTLMAAQAITSTASAQSTIRIGEPVRGTLSASDPVMEVDGSNYDCYILSTRAGQSYAIDLTSSDFDTFIGMGPGRACQPPVEQTNDDVSEDNTNSRLIFTASGGDYFILANSYGAGETGVYRLIVTERGTTTSAAQVPNLTRPREAEDRYDFDLTCAAFGTLGMIELMQQEMSDAELQKLLSDNYTLLTNAEQSGAALGKSSDDVNNEIAQLAADLIQDSEAMEQLPPVPTRAACLGASGL